VKLARHSEWRQTDRYTDPKSLPLFAEMEKLGVSLPSSLASLNFGKTGQNSSKVIQSDFASENPKVLLLRGETARLGMAVPSWESSEMVPEGGLGLPMTESVKGKNGRITDKEAQYHFTQGRSPSRHPYT